MKKFVCFLFALVLSVSFAGSAAIAVGQIVGTYNRAGNDSENGKYIKLAGGLNGSENVTISRRYILDYMYRDFSSVTRGLLISLMCQNGDISHPKEIPVSWQSRLYEKGAEYRVELSLLGDFSDAVTFYGKGDYPNQSDGGENCIYVSNLMVNKKYYYRIVGKCVDGVEYFSETGSFTTEGTPARWVNWGKISNSRDLGGWRTQSGAFVRQGMIYRSARMQEIDGTLVIDENTAEYIIDVFGLKTDIDLRGVYDDAVSVTEGIYGKMELVSAPIHAYADMLTNKDTGYYLKNIFSVFADESKYPMYIHCSAGADRTGMVAFLLNGLLGVSYEDLIRDFELTSFSDQTLRYRANDMEGIAAFLMQYKGNNFSAVNEAIEFWLKDHVGVTDGEITSIRRILTETGV